MSQHGFFEEEALGKAYDSRLMKRLLSYLRPYKGWVVIAVIALLLQAAAQVSLAIAKAYLLEETHRKAEELERYKEKQFPSQHQMRQTRPACLGT